MQKTAINSALRNTKEVSAFDLFERPLKLITLLFALATFGINFGAAAFPTGLSNSDTIDPNFNVRLQTNSFGSKAVQVIKVLPDDKILASGFFNTYNGQPVSGFVRLNSDGSLDSTFNNNLLAADSSPPGILLLTDGKIIISGSNLKLDGQTEPTKSVLRLNADGTIDPTFSYFVGGIIHGLAVDSSGRILLRGIFQVTEDGVQVSRLLIRVNADGVHDSTFRFQPNPTIDNFVLQNNKIIVGGREPTQSIIYRINEDGSIDSSFTPTGTGNFFHREILVQPDNKILVLNEGRLIRLNENGGADTGFQVTNFPRPSRGVILSSDGRITVSYGNTSLEGVIFLRLMPNGTADPSFSVFTYITHIFGAQGVQADGGILIGDNNPGFGALNGNGFIRLQPNGTVDSGFNPGGTGFLSNSPGNVRSIAVQADGKILIGGRFDVVGGVLRSNIARLNPDATPDPTFQINTSGTGNYFSQIRDIYNIRVQNDGKLVVTGGFIYFVNGVQKVNIVRLNTDGSIDSSFIPSITLVDTFAAIVGGSNRFVFQSDGKIVIGSSRYANAGPPVTVRLNVDGNLDNTFFSPAYTSQNPVNIMDVAIQPDEKILIGGRYEISNTSGGVRKSFLARLNTNGSTDQSFQVPEETNKEISVLKLLSDGKILIAKLEGGSATPPQSSVHRLNSDGSVDDSFNAGIGANGKINALLVLPSGKIMVGGKFTVFNGEPRKNLVKLSEDGNPDLTFYTVNEEVLCLALDNEQRILVGGNFTTISIGGEQNFSRSYAARLIEGVSQTRRTRFDFNGDGRADLAAYAQSTGEWSILRSGINQSVTTKFGTNGDKTAAADFDGDGKTDIAVYRPSDGNWYLLQSRDGFTAFRWGAAEDKPVPADFDGDGKADIAVFRPGSGTWFIYQSSNNQWFAVNFGLADDIALTDADFDGDGRADIAVWRPSNGFYYWLASASNNQFNALQFGQQGDIPAVADYNGDGKDDLAVFRPSTGTWFQNLTTAAGSYTFSAVQFGQNGDIPAAADYDGDGKTDIAVRRNEVWHILKSKQGYSGLVFGSANAQPVAALQN